MSYRRYTDSVLCPISSIAAERATPALSRLRTAVRWKSCGMRPAIWQRDKHGATRAITAARSQYCRSNPGLIGRPGLDGMCQISHALGAHRRPGKARPGRFVSWPSFSTLSSARLVTALSPTWSGGRRDPCYGVWKIVTRSPLWAGQSHMRGEGVAL
jgi:hypothetical protein